MKRFFLCLFLLITFSFGAPGWLPFGSVGSGGVNSSGGAIGDNPRPRTTTKVVRDTLFVRDTLYFDRVDTIIKVDTIQVFPIQYKYVVRYALTSLNVSLNNPEWLDYASVNEIVARDTATLRIGSEEVRTLGYIIGEFGNKVPQTDIITYGFTIQISGNRVVIEYRGKNSLALFSGSFDNDGFLTATGEITENSFIPDFFPFNLFFNVGKKRIIIEIIREVRQ